MSQLVSQHSQDRYDYDDQDAVRTYTKYDCISEIPLPSVIVLAGALKSCV